jgi:hypothetical protein
MKNIVYYLALFVLFFSCGNGVNKTSATGPVKPSPPFCSSPQKITAIYKDYVYDLSGYEGVAGNSAFNLFDENAMVDPKGKTEYHPVTNPNPILANTFYWPKNRGNRIVVDLQVPYKLSEVYLYDMARQSDSVWIYTGNMQKWKLKTSFATKGDVTQWGWRRFSIDDSSRYIMIRLNSWEANITEAVFYGCAYGKIPAPPSKEYTGPRLPAKSLREFLGINTYQTVPLKWMKPFYNTRMYTPADFIDRDTMNEYPKQQFNLAAQGWFNGAERDYTFFADSIVRYANARIWYSLKGVPYWMKKKGLDDWDRPVSKIGMNTEDPLSYGRHASMLWHLAALYGNVKVDTNLLQVYNSPRFSGRGLMNVFENGNEVDANWVGNKYCNPVEYFAVSSADYDGHEGRLGKYHGLKNADPSAELMMAGLCGLDTNRVRILNFLCQTLRNDRQFLWKGGVQYHSYSVDGKGRFPGEAFAYATRGTSPEEDSLRIRMQKVRDYTYRFAPGVECILGEYGYDKNQQSKMSTPIVKGYNRLQSQGIMLLRGINAISFSGIDRLIIYWIKDDYGDDEKTYFLTCGLIKHVAQDQYEPYPAWYYISTLINNMGDYVPEKIISEKGNVWVYKYRHKTQRDSAAYFVYCPTYNGTKVDNYSLHVGNVNNSSVTEISLKDNSETGDTRPLPVNGGAVKINVTESPKFVFVREK